MEQLHVAKDTLARTLPELVRHSERLEEEKAKLEEQNAWQARQIQQQAERLDALQRDLDVLRARSCHSDNEATLRTDVEQVSLTTEETLGDPLVLPSETRPRQDCLLVEKGWSLQRTLQ